jgi:hypothetical protein
VRSFPVIAVSSFLLAGCIPFRFVDTPGITGTVVGVDHEQPIAGATVQLDLKHSGYSAEPIQMGATTDASGMFEIAPHRIWSVMLAGGEYALPRLDKVRVSAPGFSVATIDLRWSVVGKSITSLGVVRLESLPDGRPNTSLERTRER